MQKDVKSLLKEIEQQIAEIKVKIETLNKLQEEENIWFPETGEPAIFYDHDREHGVLAILASYDANKKQPFKTHAGMNYLRCAPVTHYIYQKPIKNWKPKVGEICLVHGTQLGRVIDIDVNNVILYRTIDGYINAASIECFSTLYLDRFNINKDEI